MKNYLNQFGNQVTDKAEEIRKKAEEDKKKAEDEARRKAEEDKRAADEAARRVKEATNAVASGASNAANAAPNDAAGKGKEAKAAAEAGLRGAQQFGQTAAGAFVAGVTQAQQFATSVVNNLADPSIGTVNGEKFYTPVDGYLLVIKAVNERKPRVEIKTYEPAVVSGLKFMVARNSQEFKRKMEDELKRQFGISRSDIEKLLIPSKTNTTYGPSRVSDPVTIAAIFAGVAAVITATAALVAAKGVATVGVITAAGAVIVMILLVLAIIYAISEGYDVEGVEFSVGPDGRPTLKFSLKNNNNK